MLTMLANVRAEEDDYYKHNSQSFEGIWMKFDFFTVSQTQGRNDFFVFE